MYTSITHELVNKSVILPNRFSFLTPLHSILSNLTKALVNFVLRPSALIDALVILQTTPHPNNPPTTPISNSTA